MHIALSRRLLPTAFTLLALDTAGAQQQQPQQRPVVMNASQLRWVAGPASLPPGARMAVVEGDPGRAGPFTIRLRFPANYRVGPHSHTATERLTIISGALTVGMGQQETRGTTTLTAGGYASMPGGMVHHARTTRETVLQLSSTGPFDIRYVNAADDPRQRTAQPRNQQQRTQQRPDTQRRTQQRPDTQQRTQQRPDTQRRTQQRPDTQPRNPPQRPDTQPRNPPQRP